MPRSIFSTCEDHLCLHRPPPGSRLNYWESPIFVELLQETHSDTGHLKGVFRWTLARRWGDFTTALSGCLKKEGRLTSRISCGEQVFACKCNFMTTQNFNTCWMIVRVWWQLLEEQTDSQHCTLNPVGWPTGDISFSSPDDPEALCH